MIKLEDINADTQVKMGSRVYLAKDIFPLFDVRGIPYEVIENDEITE
jgi:hypothetical protein